VLSGEVSGPVAQQTAINLAASYVGGKKEKVINLLNIGGVQQVMCEVRVAEIAPAMWAAKSGSTSRFSTAPASPSG
jgi:pilus assembly protein CpaC